MLSALQISQIKELIREAGDIANTYQEQGFSTYYKEDGSPVTDADINISKLIVEGLSQITPGVMIISEEDKFIPKYASNIFWLIDPIDGTNSYIDGEFTYTVNIGLVIDNISQYGFVYQPSSQVLYYTNHNKQFIMEVVGEIVEESQAPSVMKAVLSTRANDVALGVLAENDINEYEIISGAIKFGLIASGAADIWPRTGTTMEWDTAAGQALIKASGGEVVDFEGKELVYGKPNFTNGSFIAYSPRLFNKRKQC